MVRPQSQRRVQDRYELQQALGRGGMGVVWLAEDAVLQRKVAVKEMEFPPGVPVEEIDSLKARVMREARAAGRLNHPNVTTIFDVITDDSGTWIVMEYVDAPTLTEIVSREGPLSVERTVGVGLALLGALEAAHAAGIVHRDVKPGNVMVKDNGNVKLADFGVAAIQGDPKITVTGLIIGSPSFMAPEQAKEGVSGPASDMWGLGATLYYAVEGRPPFDRGAAIPTLTAVIYEAPDPMERAGELGAIIERLLEKDPERRPTAGELRTLLDEVAATPLPAPASTWFWDNTSTPAPGTVVLDGDAAQHWNDEDDADLAAAAPGRNRSAWPWVIAAAMLLLIAGLTLPSLLDSGATDVGPNTAERGNQAVNQADDGAAEDPEPADEPEVDNVDEPADPPVAASDPPTTEPSEPAPADDPGDDAVAIPEGWTTYEIGTTGSTVAYPAEWEQIPRAETRTDLADPGGGRYLRVEYTDTPGDDAVQAWEDFSDAFAASHDNYTEISIEPYEYGNKDAALWEYTYSEGGTQLHAYNLAIVTGGRGYALNFQTREDQWAESQEMWQQFVDSFDPSK